MDLILDTLVKRVGLIDACYGDYEPSFGYNGKELILSNIRGRLQLKTEDFIFTTAKKFTWKTIKLPIKSSLNDDLPITYISDHRALNININLK